MRAKNDFPAPSIRAVQAEDRRSRTGDCPGRPRRRGSAGRKQLKRRVPEADLQVPRTIPTLNVASDPRVNRNHVAGADEQISLAAAAELPELRVDGHPRDRVSLWRWATRGVRGVVLETNQVGDRLCTTRAAIKRFLDAMNVRRASAAGPAALVGHWRREHERAERSLEARGL